MKTPFIAVALGLVLGAQVTWAQAPARQVPPVFAEAPGLLSGQRLTQTQQYYSGYKVLHLDVAALRTQLAGAPLEFTGSTPVLLTLPLPQGGTATFKVFDSPVLAPNIAAQNPGIKTYSLQAVSGPATGRLSFIDGVLNAVLFQADGEREVYFQHLDGVADAYLSYSTGQVKALPKSGPNAYKSACGTVSTTPAPAISKLLASAPSHNGLGQRTGATLRTYRLAVSATKEFTSAQGSNTQAGGLAAVVTMVNVAKGVYRRELSVDFTLVSGTNTICTSAVNPTAFASDNAGSNPDHVAMLAQNQTFVDAQVGNGNYDIGHVLGFETGGGSGGGVASKSSLCRSNDKAEGVSAVNQPSTSFPQVYQDQVFVHEMGHQFSMDHSFNSSIPVCTTREAAVAVEPGSGTTIMSYGYTCSGQAGNSDDYLLSGQAGAVPILNFHAANLAQAVAYMTTTATCNTSTATNNSVPTISTVSTGFTIPKSTPFALTGAASGGAGTLSYSWEGMDTGATPARVGSTNTPIVPTTELDDASKAPFFRSYAPMSTATRTFPLLSAILDGTNQAKGDKLPSVGRTINLRLTTRDGMGGVDEMSSALTVDGNSGPFLITSNLAGTYASGSTQTVTWSVNNTNQAPVSCTNVAIMLSTDGGQTFGTTLLASTANDGTESVTLPYLGTATSQARLKVQAVGNIFFDISNSNFSINAGQAPVLTLTTSVSGSSFCAGSAISVGFVATQAPNAGNVYTAQLSDASGSFASPVSLGTLSSVATSGSVSGTIPAGTAQGAGYRVRVVGSDPTTTGTDNGTNLTINNTPAPTGTASQSFSSGATVASLAATGTAVQWYAASTGGTALAGTTALVSGTTYYATQTLNGCESLSRLAVTVTVSAPTAPDLTVSTGSSTTPTTVAAGTYNSITVTGTGYAQLSGAVIVNTTVAVQDGGTLSTNCQALTGAASFTLAAGGTLVICDANGITASGATGAVQTTGTRSFSTDANYVYNNNGSTTTQNTGNGLPAQVRNLTINNTAATNQTSATSVSQIMTMAGSGNFNTLNAANQFTLLSTAAQTALIAQVGTGAVSRTTVQRYIDGTLNSGLGYRHFSSPVNATTMASLANGTFSPSFNTAYNTSAAPATVTPFPNVFGYDQSRIASATNNLSDFDKGWYSPAATTDALSIFQGYTLNAAAGQTLSLFGVVQGGGGVLFGNLQRGTNANAGWQLLGNPFASPLDFSLIPAGRRSGLDAAIYVFQSTGQYTGGYRSYINGVGGGNPVLPLGQAFFIRVSTAGTTGALNVQNADRVKTLNYTPFQRTAASQRPLVQFDLKGNGLADAFYAYAEAGATAGFDSEYDAAKLPNTHGLNVSTTAGTVEALSIDGRPAFTVATGFPLTVSVPAAGTYTFTAAVLDNLPAGLTAYIYDAATASSTALSVGSVYSFQVTAAQAAAPVAGRFTLQFSPNAPLAATPAALATQVSVFPNPAHEQVTVALPGIAGATVVQAELLNSLGQVVRRQSAALPAAGTSFVLPTAGLAAGVYVLRLTAGETFVAKRLTIQ